MFDAALAACLALSLAFVATSRGVAQNPESAGEKRVLIICGHPGDDEHERMFADSVSRIRDALVSRFGFASDAIRVQFGSKEGEEPAVPNAHGRATREEIENEAQRLAAELNAQDTLWVIVLGHAHFDGRVSFLNLPGRDVTFQEFAELFHAITCRQQLFVLTNPLSGFAIKPLSRPGRIVITATEADLELNETLFHSSLAKVLNEIELNDQYDADKDARLSVFDLYIAVVRDVVPRYLDEMLIPTEHAQLDDNGDGRGAEVQIDYLTPEQGGREGGRKQQPRIGEETDGQLAKRLELELSP
jgi:hypothetical protein